MCYEEGIKRKFPGYELDSDNIVRNVADSTIDLEQHMEFMKSTDRASLDAYE